MAKRNRSRGQTAILLTLSLIPILAMVGLVVDLGIGYWRKTECQTAAQSAAIAGAMAAKNRSMTCGASSTTVPCQAATVCPASLTNGSDPIQAACLYAKQNGYTNGGNISVKVAADLSSNTPAPVTGISPTYWMRVTISQSLPQTFSAALGNTLATAKAQSTAGFFQAGGGGCLYILNATSQGITNSGNVAISSGCGIYVDSNSSSAILFSGSPSITTTNGATTNVVGGITKSGSPTISPAPILGAPYAPDPFLNILGAPSGVFSVTPPATGTCMSNPPLSGSGNYTLNPGTYCTSITMSGSVHVTLNAGTYVLQNGITMSGLTSISGTDVTLYVSGGGVSMSGTGGITLTAPTSGTYAGIAIWQPYSNTSADTLSGATAQQINGVVYVPKSTLTYSGGSGLGTNTTIVCDKLVMSGNTYINNSAPNAFAGGAGGAYFIE